MKTHRISSLLLSAVASLALFGGACMGETEEDLSDAISSENGGLDMEDEAPMFGVEDEFALAGEHAVDTVVDDGMEDDAAVVAMLELPDAVVVKAAVVWGKMPADLDADTPRNWSGTLSVNRGALLVRSTIAFEGADHLLPRDDPRAVSFVSRTLPHRDGMRLTIIDPTPEAPEPLVLRYSTAEGDLYTAPIAALLAGPVSVPVDDDGNRIAGIAIARPIDVCEHGFLGGKWHAIRPGLGRMIGRVVDADGNLKGHVRGVYGERDDGRKQFFGKYINTDGQFRGLFVGEYGGGEFRGRWLTRAGERGVLGGEYRETVPGPSVGGHFLGRWAETTCEVDAE